MMIENVRNVTMFVKKTKSDAFLDSRQFMQKYQKIWNVDLASFVLFWNLVQRQMISQVTRTLI